MTEKNNVLITLKKLIEYEETLLQNDKIELKKMPEGKLITRKKGEKIYYTCKHSSHEHGISKDKILLETLFRKMFLTLSIEIRSDNIFILKEAFKSIFNNINKISSSKHSSLCSYSKIEIDWINSCSSQNSYALEHLIYKCNNGLMVRSKSERTIVNKLLEYGIIFKYEAPIEIGGFLYYPDFTILKKDGTIVLWEHFGLMNNEEYLVKSLQKIRKYKTKGFVQYKNLICTEEDDIKDESILDEIIMQFLL